MTISTFRHADVRSRGSGVLRPNSLSLWDALDDYLQSHIEERLGAQMDNKGNHYVCYGLCLMSPLVLIEACFSNDESSPIFV